jgi:hypothetical protein
VKEELFGWFCIGFALFFAVGAIVGYLNRVPPVNAIDIVAARHVALAVKNQNFTLTYVCKGHDYFDFYLKDGALVPDQKILDHPPISRPLSFENFETIVVAATGWELRGVVASATGAVLTQRQKIALFLGSVSGFYAGRWLTSTRMPSCNADEVIERLIHVEYWDTLKREKCKQVCLRYKLWFSAANIKPLALNVTPLIEAAKEVQIEAPKGAEETNRSLIVGYLERLDKTFRKSSSNDAKISEYDFRVMWGGIPYLLGLLYENPQITKKAFSSHVPQLVIVLNDDPAVIDREVSEKFVPLTYVRGESYQENFVTAGVLIVGFLIAVIFGSVVLVGERISSRMKTRDTPQPNASKKYKSEDREAAQPAELSESDVVRSTPTNPEPSRDRGTDSDHPED